LTSISGRICPIKTRILHIINGEHYSGAERVQDLLATGLLEYGFEVWFACVKKGLFHEKCSSSKKNIILFSMRSRFDIGQGIKIATYARKHGFSFLHSHTPRTIMVGFIAAVNCGLPLVHHLHSPTIRDSERRFLNRVNAWLENHLMHLTRKTIAVSPSLYRHAISEGLKAGRLVTIPNGVPTGEMNDLVFTDGRFRVSTVALFRPRKGL
jgi:hypothetical protein